MKTAKEKKEITKKQSRLRRDYFLFDRGLSRRHSAFNLQLLSIQAVLFLFFFCRCNCISTFNLSRFRFHPSGTGTTSYLRSRFPFENARAASRRAFVQPDGFSSRQLSQPDAADSSRESTSRRLFRTRFDSGFAPPEKNGKGSPFVPTPPPPIDYVSFYIKTKKKTKLVRAFIFDLNLHSVI